MINKGSMVENKRSRNSKEIPFIAVGEGVEPSRGSYYAERFFLIPHHRDKEACLPSFTTLHIFYFANLANCFYL